MKLYYTKKSGLLFIFLAFFSSFSIAQSSIKFIWSPDGNTYISSDSSNIIQYSLPQNTKTVLVSKGQLMPTGQNKPLQIHNFSFSNDNRKVLIYTNTRKVWRYETRGDYWILNLQTKELKQLGKQRPASSLMFAKLSPDANKVAYVSERNIYIENLQTNESKQLTFSGDRKVINGTFDWAYEEEFLCRDGFRWSPNSKQIAFWQIDARKVRDFLMINNTDSIYPFAVPVEYPVVGEPPSPYKIGIINVGNSKTLWMDIPGDPQQNYIPRMEWAANSGEIIVQQLNRKQNESRLMLCNTVSGKVKNLSGNG